eukprot:TRINITY_DN23567_c0_g1_i1.p1 TRINITY_DN23567_c0_g1~~TRINITY_DN23567_c0_g1_i1.p1  ORF type:complete len:2215 (+),score=281.46 TRINITY_DN23567_c0_g1_i1:40-6645(+)
MDAVWIPAILCAVLGVNYAVFQVVSWPIYRWRKRKAPDAETRKKIKYVGPLTVWVRIIIRFPCLSLCAGFLVPIVFTVTGLNASGFNVKIDVEFGDYLKAELPEQFILDVSNAAAARQQEKIGHRRRRSEEYSKWNFMEAMLQKSPSLQAVQTEPAPGPIISNSRQRRLAGRPLSTQTSYVIHFFYEAIDENEGIFTKHALEEIKDFENRIKASHDYSSFCRMTWEYDVCDAIYSVTNVFFSVPNASESDGNTMGVLYDGSGDLASIPAILRSFLREDVKWWTDKDFGPKNLKSRYTRASFYGGLPLPGYVSAEDRNTEQTEKVRAFLTDLWDKLLRRADVTGPDALPYKHVKMTWSSTTALYGHEMMYYLSRDCMWAAGAISTVSVLVIARQQNLFVVLCGALGVLLAFSVTYYFQYVVYGYDSLSVLDLVSLFLVIGIAADDIILLFNAYQLAPAVVGVLATPQKRMKWAFQEASSAMLVTTVTTCGSFFSNCFSVVTVVKRFGFFMGTLAAWNYIHVLTIFATSILVSDLYLMPLLRKICCSQKYGSRGDQSLREASGETSARSETSTPKKPKGRPRGEILDETSLDFVERQVRDIIFPALKFCRFPFILLFIGLSISFAYLAAEGFRLASGDLELFDEDINLGRSMRIQQEIFPATNIADLSLAVGSANPHMGPQQVRSCPRAGLNNTFCHSRGSCDVKTGSCICDEGVVGRACSLNWAPPTLELWFHSPVPASPENYWHIHVLATPLLSSVPASTAPETGQFALANAGDANVLWELLGQTSWLVFVPAAGNIPRRMFDRNDQSVSSPVSVEVKFKLAGRNVGWTAESDMIIRSPTAGVETKTVTITASVLPPPALANLSLLVHSTKWPTDAKAIVSPAFDLMRGFSQEAGTNLLWKPAEATYTAHVPHEVQSVKVQTYSFGLTGDIRVDGIPSNGISHEISIPVLPNRATITVTVTSSYSNRVHTVYKLEVARDHSGFPEFIQGSLTLSLSNCSVLLTAAARSDLAEGIAFAAAIDKSMVKVRVHCTSRRLEKAVPGRHLLEQTAIVSYEIELPPGKYDLAVVEAKMNSESKESMAEKLMRALANGATRANIVIVLQSFDVPIVNPPTSTATSTAIMSSTSVTASSATATARAVTAASAPTFNSQRTSVTVTSTSRTITSKTMTITISTVTSTRPASSISTSTSGSFDNITATVPTSRGQSWTTSTATSITRTITSATTTSTSTAESETEIIGSIIIQVGMTCASFVADSFRRRIVTMGIANAAGVLASDVRVSLSCGLDQQSPMVEVDYVITLVDQRRLRRLSESTATVLSALQDTSRLISSITSAAQEAGSLLTISLVNVRTPVAQAATLTFTSTRSSVTGTATSTTTASTRTTSRTRITSTSITITQSTSVTSTTLTETIAAGADSVYGYFIIELVNCMALNTTAGLHALVKGVAAIAQVEDTHVSVMLKCGQRLLQEDSSAAVARYSNHATVVYGISMPGVPLQHIWASLVYATPEFMASTLNTQLAGVVAGANLTVVEIARPSFTKAEYCSGTPTCTGKGNCARVTPSSPGAPAWQCRCLETYTGPDCSRRACPTTCQQNGTCREGREDLDSIWGCNCPAPFGGDRCELRRCPGNCSEAGSCDSNSGVCACLPGYGGADCSIEPPKKVPISNCIEVSFVWGLRGYKSEDVRVADYDDEFDFFNPEVQAWIHETCAVARKDIELRVREEAPCWIEVFSQYVTSVGGHFPVPRSHPGSDALRAFMHFENWMPDNAVKGLMPSFQSDIETDGLDFSGRVKFVRVSMKSDMAINGDLAQRTLLREKWVKFADARDKAAPTSVGKMHMVGSTWASMELESQVFSSTVMAFSGSLAVSLVAMTVFTRNVILATYVTLNIMLVVCVLAGFLLNIQAYEFGVVEAVGSTIFVGMSVDYCLHVAHGYNEAPGKTSEEKARHMLIVWGPSIASGALTTIAGCAFLLPCRMILFQKLGWVLLSNALISVAYSFVFLVPLLIVAGPTGARGKIFRFPRPQHLEPNPKRAMPGDATADDDDDNADHSLPSDLPPLEPIPHRTLEFAGDGFWEAVDEKRHDPTRMIVDYTFSEAVSEKGHDPTLKIVDDTPSEDVGEEIGEEGQLPPLPAPQAAPAPPDVVVRRSDEVEVSGKEKEEKASKKAEEEEQEDAVEENENEGEKEEEQEEEDETADQSVDEGSYVLHV